MISHHAHDGARTSARGSTWQCLVRRGMLFSECDSIEHVFLSAGDELHAGGLAGSQEIVLVLSGSVTIRQGAASSAAVAGAVLPLDQDARATVMAEKPSEILCTRTLSDAVSRALPERRPELVTGSPRA